MVFELSFFAALLDAFPAPVFIVDEDVRILSSNLAARPFLSAEPEIVYRRRAGEALHCLRATDHPDGCGRGPLCRTCVIRNSVSDAFGGDKVIRRTARLILQKKDSQREVYVLVTTAPFQHEGKRYVILTLEDINEIVELRKLIPICANCKRIRDEREYWENLETYFKNRLDVDFSHGICPDCVRKLYPELPDPPLWRAERETPV